LKQHIEGEVKIFVVLHRAFSHDSVGERILEIGSHFAKVIIKHQVAHFLGQSTIVSALHMG